MLSAARKIMKRGLGCQGLSVVEMALVIPLLLVMIFGIVETSNLFRTWLTLQKAAQTGARYAATGQGETEGTRLSQIIQVTNEKLLSLDGERAIKVRSWSSEIPSGEGVLNDPGEPCQMVEVEIEYTYQLLIPLAGELGPLLPETIPLSASDRKVNEPWKPCDSD